MPKIDRDPLINWIRKQKREQETSTALLFRADKNINHYLFVALTVGYLKFVRWQEQEGVLHAVYSIEIERA